MAKRQRLSSASKVTRDADQATSDYSGFDSDASSYGGKTRTRKRKATKKISRPNKSKSTRIPSLESVEGQRGGCVILHSSSDHIISSPGPLQTALLQWYQTVHEIRGMPWRKTYDPLLGPKERAQRAYEVWVSEIMLQQTQVATVIPYYTRWMERFPTISELAAASIDQVNALWKGLGYYSRASRLLAGAQKAVTEYNGMLPDNAKDLEANIPGIGRYSAGAIASIAYGEHAPVLDGNVHRLLSRVLALHAPPKSKATLDILWNAAAAMVKAPADPTDTLMENSAGSVNIPQYPGDINQALIELGSTICKVRDPTCDACPLQPWCRVYQVTQPHYKPVADIEDMCSLCEPLPEITVTAYPMKADRKKPREELDIVNVVEWTSSTGERWFLMVRRPDGGLLAGLYEFPTSSNVAKTTSETAQIKIPRAILGQLLAPSVLPYNSKQKTTPSREDLIIKSIKPVSDVAHIFSHIKKTYRPQWVALQGGDSPPLLKGDNGSSSTSKLVSEDGSPRSSDHAMWVRLEDVPNINMGTGVAKIWTLMQDVWGDS